MAYYATTAATPRDFVIMMHRLLCLRYAKMDKDEEEEEGDYEANSPSNFFSPLINL